LTRREKQVVALVAQGTNAEVARILWLSPGTVRKHLENAYAKLGVTNRTAAVAAFFGLVAADEDAGSRGRLSGLPAELPLRPSTESRWDPDRSD
jgi:DNA-binding CsgD family transcriptional regulator